MRKADDPLFTFCEERKACIGLDFGFGIKLLERDSLSSAMRNTEEAMLLEVFKLLCWANTKKCGKAAENSGS